MEIQSRRAYHNYPSHKLEDYVGVYHHPGYGDLSVELKDKKLVFTYNAITTELEHWHYETFNGLSSEDPTFEDSKITFGTDVAGRVAWLEAQLEPTLDPIRLTKKPDARLFDPAYLQRFVGRYQVTGQVVTVSLIRFINDDKGNVTGLELNQGGAVFEAKRLEEKD